MELYRRELYLKRIRNFYDSSDIIKVITGVRRCGKSSLLEVVKLELLERGVQEEDIIFIDLDSRKYRKVKDADKLEEVIDDLSVTQNLKYIFIDEIQNVENFEEIINAYRTEGHYSIFITGSNSYLLSGELVTKLTGRYIEIEMFPLNFFEYMEMKRFYNKVVNDNLQYELNNYIHDGGFPRSIFINEIADKRMYVSSIVREIFEKDIKQRVKVRNVEAFNVVRDFVINNYGATLSIASIHRALQGNGLIIKRETISRYIDELVKSKILYQCDRFDMKSKRSLAGEKKYYLADTAFYFAMNTDNRINYGPVLENIVYVYARSNGYSVSVGRIGKLECDFILRDSDMNYSYIQVAYTINESLETAAREFKPLEMIKDNYPRYLMTTDYLLQRNNGIRHVNLLEYIKSNNKF